MHGSVVQSGVISNIHINGSVNSGRVYQASRGLSLPERRQKFHFDFLNHTLKQAEWTFCLSVSFMTGGSLIILAGGVLALVHAGNPDLSYLPLVTSLTGALITIGGGALTLHSKRTMANLTKAADAMPTTGTPARTFSPDALRQIRRERGVHDGPAPTLDSLLAALKTALTPETRARARSVAGRMRTDGTTVAAKLLLDPGHRTVRRAGR